MKEQDRDKISSQIDHDDDTLKLFEKYDDDITTSIKIVVDGHIIKLQKSGEKWFQKLYERNCRSFAFPLLLALRST